MIQLAQLMEIRPGTGQAVAMAEEPAAEFFLELPAETDLAQTGPAGAEVALAAAIINAPGPVFPAQLALAPGVPQGAVATVEGFFSRSAAQPGISLHALAGVEAAASPALAPTIGAGAEDVDAAAPIAAAPMATGPVAAAIGPSQGLGIAAVPAAPSPVAPHAMTGPGPADSPPVDALPLATALPAQAGGAVVGRVLDAGTAGIEIATIVTGGVAVVDKRPVDSLPKVTGSPAQTGGAVVGNVPDAPVTVGSGANVQANAAPFAMAPDSSVPQAGPASALPATPPLVQLIAPGSAAAPTPVPATVPPSGTGLGALAAAAPTPDQAPLAVGSPPSPLPVATQPAAPASGAPVVSPKPASAGFPISRQAAAELRFLDRLVLPAAPQPADQPLAAPRAGAPWGKRAAVPAPAPPMPALSGAPEPAAVTADPMAPADAALEVAEEPADLASPPGPVDPEGPAAPALPPAQTAPLPVAAGADQGPAPLAGLTEVAATGRSPDLPAVAPLPAPPPAEVVTRQVAERIATLGADRAEVQLSPAELGRLRFEITQRGESVQVVISAERAETLDLLRRNGDQLLVELRSMGFSGSALNFGAWGGRSSGAEPPPPQESEPLVAPEPIVAAPLTTRAPARADGRGLDLRL